MSVKLIAFREDTWFAPLAERQLYGHLATAYNVDYQMITEWAEAEYPSGHPVIVLHEQGDVESRAFDHPPDAVYVFGRTGLDLLGAVPNPTARVRIETPGSSMGVFGAQIAAILLRDRQVRGL